MTFCTPGVLKELDIKLDIEPTVGSFPRMEPFRFDSKLMIEARQFIQNLQKLTLKGRNSILHDIYVYYRQDIRNLQQLTLTGFCVVRDWQRLFPIRNGEISELRLYNFDVNESVQKYDTSELYSTDIAMDVFIHVPRSAEHAKLPIVKQLMIYFPNVRAFGYTAKISKESSKYGFEDKFDFFMKFEQLTEIYVYCEKSKDIPKLLQFLPNIKVFGILNFGPLHKPSVETRKIAHSIGNIIEKRKNHFPENDRIKVLVNPDQLKEFQNIENVDTSMELAIWWDQITINSEDIQKGLAHFRGKKSVAMAGHRNKPSTSRKHMQTPKQSATKK